MLLGIDCGTTTTRAVLVGPHRRWHPVLIDGRDEIPSGVYVSADGTLLPGWDGWRHGIDDPHRYVAQPLTQLTAETVEVAGRRINPVDLLAATLTALREAATGQAGTPPTAVRLVVPATYGPRRKTALRTAVVHAGLPQPHLEQAPAGVAAGLARTGHPIPVGGAILVADFGATRFTAAIVHHTAAGFDVGATQENTTAGATAIDTALANHITATAPAAAGNQPPPDAAGGAARVLAAAVTAKHALAHTWAVAVPGPDGVSVVVDQPTLHTLAQPVITAAADTAQAVIAAAGLAPTGLAGVFCVGGGAHYPPAVQTLRDRLGVPVTVVDRPQQAALLGALDTTTADPTPPVRSIPAGWPRIRHYSAALVPLLAALVTLVQVIVTALPVPVAGIFSPIGSVIANWGQYAMAGVLLTQTALAVAVLAAAVGHSRAGADPTTNPATTTTVPITALLARLLPAAALTGVAAAGLAGVIAALWQHVPAGPFLRWTLLPALPVAVAATTAGILAPRRPPPPTRTWIDWYTTPVAATTATAAGMLLIQFGHTNTDPTLAPAAAPATVIGVLAIAAGIAATLPAGRGWRAAAVLPLILAAGILTLGYATGALAGLYTLTVTAWWLTRAIHLPQPATTPSPAPPADTVPGLTTPASTAALGPVTGAEPADHPLPRQA